MRKVQAMLWNSFDSSHDSITFPFWGRVTKTFRWEQHMYDLTQWYIHHDGSRLNLVSELLVLPLEYALKAQVVWQPMNIRGEVKSMDM